VAYLAGVARGDWGESLVSQQPVAEMIAQNLGPTAALASGALLVGVVLGVSLGVIAGTAGPRAVRYWRKPPRRSRFRPRLLDGHAGDLFSRSLCRCSRRGGHGART
jgi:hypothetical protein